MKLQLLLLQAAAASLPLGHRQEVEQFEGYLVTTFTHADHAIDMYLSEGKSPLEYRHINDAKPILQSDVGTGGVRDPFLAVTPERDAFYLLATDLDARAPGHNWDDASRTGSHSLVIWNSTDLVNWSEPSLVRVEDDNAGMTWAPSAIYNETTSEWYVWWSTRLFADDDLDHTGEPSRTRIRYATTRDFATFSAPQDYFTGDNSVIDQEFQYLGTPGHYARWLKDDNSVSVYMETTTDGLFGAWTRPAHNNGFVTTAGSNEGAASFKDIDDENKYYLLLDTNEVYILYETTDIESGVYTESPSGFPGETRHGSVIQVTQKERDSINAAFS